MHVGLMAGTIRRETLGETLDAIVEHDVHHLQYHVPAGTVACRGPQGTGHSADHHLSTRRHLQHD